MTRVVVLLAALAALLALAPGARAQQDPSPIPEGSTSAPRFVGAVAQQQPVSVPPLAPQHPFMARNPWNNIHNDAYMTDAYDGPGPLGNKMTRASTFKVRECASVTFDSRGRIVTICVGLDRPVLTLMDPKTLETLASLDLPARTPRPSQGAFSDFSGGGYFYLDNRDRVVTATTDRRLLTIAVTENGFRQEREVSLASAVPQGDGIVSALPDWSGRVWFVTQTGIVGTVDQNGTVKSRPTGEAITDSFAVDDTGGVFVVTNGGLYRFDAAPDGGPVVTWKESYDNSGVRKPGQVSPGSGTTPTLMDGGLVAIADNAEHMQLAVYRRGKELAPGTPRLVCEQPVFERGKGATDNSLITAGNSLVVENNYGYSSPTATQNGQSTEPGIERVDVDAQANTCRSVWRSNERSPSVVPKLSLANGLVYVYVKEPSEDDDDLWYLTALDFHTGRTAFKFLSGEGLGYNNNYAPVTLGPDGSAYVGVLGGLVRLADATPPPGSTAPPPAPPAPPASARRGSSRTCLPPRENVTRRNAGAVYLGFRRRAMQVLGARAGRFCVFGGGRAGVSFDRNGRVRLFAVSARGYRVGRIAPGRPTATLRRAFKSRRRVARGVYLAGGRLFHVRRRRVTWIAIAEPAVIRNRRTLRAAIREAGFR